MERKLLEELLALLYKYSKTPRATVTRERYEYEKPDSATDFKKLKAREALIEHIGQLPIIATFLHPHIESTAEVDLKKALLMLAIHDIAETELGDTPTTFKSKDLEEQENKLSEQLIHKDQLPAFLEFEKRETKTAEFAKAMDAITPFLNDMLLPPEVTQKRLDIWGFDMEKIIDLQRKYFSWDNVLLNMYELLMEDYKFRSEGKTNLDLSFLNE